MDGGARRRVRHADERRDAGPVLGSGITAVNLAAASAMSGMEDVVVAGGLEMMSYVASIVGPLDAPTMDNG